MNNKNRNGLISAGSNPFGRIHLSKSTYSVFILLLSIIGAGILISSCDTNNIHKPDVTYSYIFQKNAAIELDTTQQSSAKGNAAALLHFSIISGNELVFVYKKFISSSDKISDAGGSRVLAFQIPAGMKKFNYRNQQLGQVHAFYQQNSSGSGESTAMKITRGLIRGEKLSPVSWIVKVDVTVKINGNQVHLKFHQPFYQKTLL
jgi:hypothetical protein